MIVDSYKQLQMTVIQLYQKSVDTKTHLSKYYLQTIKNVGYNNFMAQV